MAVYDCIKLSQSQGFLDWFVDTEIPPIFVDNQSTLKLAASSLVTKRSKHIQLRFHVVRDFAEKLMYCPTGKNLSDPLTKALPGFHKYLGMFHHDLFDQSDSAARKVAGALCVVLVNVEEGVRGSVKEDLGDEESYESCNDEEI